MGPISEYMDPEQSTMILRMTEEGVVLTGATTGFSVVVMYSTGAPFGKVAVQKRYAGSPKFFIHFMLQREGADRILI